MQWGPFSTKWKTALMFWYQAQIFHVYFEGERQNSLEKRFSVCLSRIFFGSICWKICFGWKFFCTFCWTFSLPPCEIFLLVLAQVKEGLCCSPSFSAKTCKCVQIADAFEPGWILPRHINVFVKTYKYFCQELWIFLSRHVNISVKTCKYFCQAM